MRYYLKNNDIAVCVQSTHDGREVIVSFERHPLSTSLGSMSPSEARTLAAMLTEQAAKCDKLKAPADNFLAAMAADDRRAA